MKLFAVVDKNLTLSAIFFELVITAPPAPVVIILLPLNDKTPATPKEPACFFIKTSLRLLMRLQLILIYIFYIF